MVTRGFTLLEMMLVVFLLGLVASGVVQTFSTRTTPPAYAEAAAFLSLFSRVRDEATLSGQTIGIRISPRKYDFVYRKSGQWIPLHLPRVSTQIMLPDSVSASLILGGYIWQREYESELQRRRLRLQDMQLELNQKDDAQAPQVWFSVHEPETPFTLRFHQSQPPACWQVNIQSGHALTLVCCEAL